MSIPETTALEAQPKLTPDKVKNLLANIDTAGMSQEDQYHLALVLNKDLEQSIDGFDFRPVRHKIQKDTQRFTDPFGNSVETLSGTMILKQKTRVLFKSGDKQPLCSSTDGITGQTWPDEGGHREARSCAKCQYNTWGSAEGDDGRERRGKACKEMRRIYLLQPGAQLPIQISLPPTSIKAFDEYMSARLSQGITDLTAEVVLALVPAKAGNYDISIIKPKVGRKLAPIEILQAYQYQREFVDRLKAIEVTADDYAEEEKDWTQAPKTGDDDIPFE